jgi:hypothetical protein
MDEHGAIAKSDPFKSRQIPTGIGIIRPTDRSRLTHNAFITFTHLISLFKTAHGIFPIERIIYSIQQNVVTSNWTTIQTTIHNKKINLSRHPTKTSIPQTLKWLFPLSGMQLFRCFSKSSTVSSSVGACLWSSALPLNHDRSLPSDTTAT